MLQDFSPRTEEALEYYVYLLVDPRDNKIFYVGKGKGDRVFAHVHCAIATEGENDKLNTIRDIQRAGLEVRHFIVRHGMEKESEAFLVESVLIDLLTFRDFSSVANITKYRGVVRAIFVPEKWYHEKGNPKRWMFEGYEVTEQNNPEIYYRYINKRLPKAKGIQNPLHYYNV